MTDSLDHWAEWLLHRRHGGDAEALRRTMEYLAPVRDRVLANAKIAPGDRVLDVGCGDGLIAFGALDRVGPSGSVIFSDVSQDLLDRCQELAAAMDVLDRCQFIRCAAEDLAPVTAASVDAVTTRSVLIYVAAKEHAFAEFFRVLRPRGRLSIFEPINRFGADQPRPDAGDAQDLADRVRAIFLRLQPPESDPMLDFDERDLLALAEAAGFPRIYLDLHAEIEPATPERWETTLHRAGNPNSPTLAEAMAEALTPEERVRYEAWLRPRIEQGLGQSRGAVAYLWAVKGDPG
ncbi:MAG: methyltransferase domain-containing protein [Thermomicrobiales bacterium]